MKQSCQEKIAGVYDYVPGLYADIGTKKQREIAILPHLFTQSSETGG